MKIVLDTLGCKLNQAETESLSQQFIQAGHTLVSRVDDADIYILNTCTVTHVADAKSRHLLRQAHRHNPAARIIATGCYAQRAPEELSRIDGVSLVIGNKDKFDVLSLLKECDYPTDSAATPGFVINQPPLRTRTFIKVQDGCGNFCSYCIVPLVRGRETSLPTDQVITEVKQRVAEGYQELVLTGTKIGSYFHSGITLKGLLERILSETGVRRLRLSSLQPQEISEGLVGLWQDRRLCPHFHLSLQSGCDEVLEGMKRRYHAEDYRDAVALIRAMVPDVAITTDVIVGFPGETEAQFAESYDFCRQLEFARIHVFPYSLRSGTVAARMASRVPEQVKQQRLQKMLALAEVSSSNFRRQFTGKSLPVLWEKSIGGVWSGLTGNYIRVHTTSREDLTNQLRLAEVD
ncbi:MAG: tRNA (N(6)-L-threonylcarbamoyladenosine(37)-C(2))-methylthiotransferase MtaB [Chloroflexota bacterium]